MRLFFNLLHFCYQNFCFDGNGRYTGARHWCTQSRKRLGTRQRVKEEKKPSLNINTHNIKNKTKTLKGQTLGVAD